MRATKQTIEKWWDGLLPVEKYLAYWAMRGLKHSNDAEALRIVRDVRELNHVVVRFFKKRERQKRKLQQAPSSRAELAVRAGWN